jgi:hypothetical protein
MVVKALHVLRYGDRRLEVHARRRGCIEAEQRREQRIGLEYVTFAIPRDAWDRQTLVALLVSVALAYELLVGLAQREVFALELAAASPQIQWRITCMPVGRALMRFIRTVGRRIVGIGARHLLDPAVYTRARGTLVHVLRAINATVEAASRAVACSSVTE